MAWRMRDDAGGLRQKALSIVVALATCLAASAGAARANDIFQGLYWYELNMRIPANRDALIDINGPKYSLRAPQAGQDGQHFALVPNCQDTQAFQIVDRRTRGCHALSVGDGPTNNKKIFATPIRNRPNFCWTLRHLPNQGAQPPGGFKVGLQSASYFPRPPWLTGALNGDLRVDLSRAGPEILPRLKHRILPLLTPVVQAAPYKSESYTDDRFHIVPSTPREWGLNAAVLFVDFNDHPGGRNGLTISEMQARIDGDGYVGRFFRNQSYGLAGVRLTPVSRSWTRMTHPSSHYSYHDGHSHKRFIQEALNKHSDVDFTNYDFVIIATPGAPAQPASVTFVSEYSQAPQAPDGTRVQQAITLGADVVRHGPRPVIHEIGHVLGLPDLYGTSPGENAENSPAGVWDIMSDAYRADAMLGWHRYKLRWLPVYRVATVRGDEVKYKVHLKPLDDTCGLSMIVVPLDSKPRTEKLLVIEAAPSTVEDFDVRRFPATTFSHGRAIQIHRVTGVLVYEVDFTKETGKLPVRVIARRDGYDPHKGNLFNAPYLLGQPFQKDYADGRRISMTVVGGSPSEGYDLHLCITKTGQTCRFTQNQGDKDELR